jgi:DNA/RNA non-specific endonuclease
MQIYQDVAAKAPNPAGGVGILRYLNSILPKIWAEAYLRKSQPHSALVTITFWDRHHPKQFVNTMFDHATGGGRGAGAAHNAEDRVVAVWGLSRSEPASTRDKTRMAGYLRGVWSDAFPSDDRGHFFAHTMGGGMDINLFPQLASVNRGGLWRKLETEAAENPGTFCFIRPIYSGTSWRPVEVEYGLFRMPPRAFGFEGYVFQN